MTLTMRSEVDQLRHGRHIAILMVLFYIELTTANGISQYWLYSEE